MAQQKKVLIYSTARCPKCREVKQYLQSKKISFVEFDVEKNRRAAKEFARLNGRGVPVLIVGNTRMDGFEKKRFDKIYQA